MNAWRWVYGPIGHLSTADICQKGTIISVQLPNGATLSVASGYGSVLTVTILTNANPGVATSTAHGLSNGDFVEVTSGWSRLTNKIVRVASVTTNTFALEGIDTTSTTVYPAGAGIGSVRKVTGFTQIQQILGVTTSGGDQQFFTYQFLEADSQVQIPTVKTPYSLQLQIGDDSSLAGYAVLSTANDDRLARAIKIVLASGAIILYDAYVSLNRIPSLAVNQAMDVKATMSFLNEPVRYTS